MSKKMRNMRHIVMITMLLCIVNALECPPPSWLPSSEAGCPCKCNGILPAACVLPCASSFSLCMPSWKSSVCRKKVTVTVSNLPQTSTFEGGMRYIFGHTPYQPLEMYQDEQRKYQNYDTYTGGVVQFDMQRKTEVETYPGGVVEFDQYDHTNAWHPIQIIDADGVVIQTSTGTSQRPATLVFEATESQAGKTFYFKDALHGPSLATGLSLKVIAPSVENLLSIPTSATVTVNPISSATPIVAEKTEILNMLGEKTNTSICVPGIVPNRTENNYCMCGAVVVTNPLEVDEIVFQSTACGLDAKFQQHKISIPIKPDRHTTTTLAKEGIPIGMLVDGTFLFSGTSTNKNKTILYQKKVQANTDNCSIYVDQHGRQFHNAMPLCLLKRLGGTVPPENAWSRSVDIDPNEVHEWVRVWPTTGKPSPLLGYAIDGFPIYGPYTEDGDLLGWGGEFPSTDYPWYDVKSKLDRCNGRTRKDGSYAYHLTPSPPYTIGCLREKQGASTSLNLDISCSTTISPKNNGTSTKTNTKNATATGASTTNTQAGTPEVYVPPPHNGPSKMALELAIESAPLDIKPLLDNKQNVSSSFCSNTVKADSLCLCYKVAANKYCAGFCSTSYSGYIGTQADGYDGTVEVTGWSCFYLRKKFVAPPKLEYACLNQQSETKILEADAKHYFTFNGEKIYNKFMKYTIGLGVTTLKSVPKQHPIAILNAGLENLISYSGNESFSVLQTVNGHEYRFYHGDVNITVNGNFNEISYYCANHGYMGGENNFKYSDACLKYECLQQASITSISNQNGNKYAFNNHNDFLSSRRYRVGMGTVTLVNVPSYHPIAILNQGKSQLIQYSGIDTGVQKIVNEHLYKFYYGNVTITVNGDFGVVDYFCYQHGYMGGEQGLEYSSSCPTYVKEETDNSDNATNQQTAQEENADKEMEKAAAISNSCSGICGDNLISKYQEITNLTHLTILTNAVPNHPYHVDRTKPNSNNVCEDKRRLVIPLNPKVNEKYTHTAETELGPIGILKTGAYLFNHLSNLDGTIANHIDTERASFDSCHGHADDNCHYHNHELSKLHTCAYDCVWDECEHIGYMRDGFKIYSHCRKGSGFLKSCYNLIDGATGTNASHYQYKSNVDCDLDEANGFDFTNRGYTDHLNNVITGYAYVVSESFPYVMPKYAGVPMPMEKYNGAIDKNYNYKCPVGSGTATFITASPASSSSTTTSSSSTTASSSSSSNSNGDSSAAPEVKKINQINQGYSYY